MDQFFVTKVETRWNGNGLRPVPQLISGPFPRDEAQARANQMNEAEGRSTDGNIGLRYDIACWAVPGVGS